MSSYQVQETKVGSIPLHWEVAKLESISSKVGSGITPRGGSKTYLDEGVPLIRSQNVLVGKLDLSDVAFISDEQHEEMSNTHLMPFDVLLNISGASIGRCCIVPPDIKEGNVNQHVCIIRPTPIIEAYFLSSILTSDIGQKQIYQFQAGGNRQGLNYQQIRSFTIPIPPLPEQRKIAEILSTWDEAIAKTEQLIAALQARKKGLIQRLLTGEVRFSKYVKSDEMQETKFGPIPADWQMKKVRQIGKVNADTLGNDGSGKKYYYVELSMVSEGDITFPTEPIAYVNLPSRARRIPHEHDVIMATVRPNLLGYATWDDELPDHLVSTGFALISPKLPVDKDFIYQSLYGDVIQRQIHGLVTGSNYPAINSTEVKNLNLCWPKNSHEREKIGQVFRSIDDEINLLIQKLKALQKQKKGLMHRLLTGDMRVKV